VDVIWHAHVLDTRRYATYCQRILGVKGALVHHDPDGGLDEAAQRARYRATLAALGIDYGTVRPARFLWWPPAADADAVQPLPPAERDNTYQIFVKGLEGRTTTYSVTPGDTTQAIKAAIERKVDVPADQQRLIFAGAQLGDDDTLRDNGVKRESTLHLVLKLRGC
jgi:hypothetical protein